MRFSFTDEQQALRESARGFLADHSSSEKVRAAMASELGFDRGVWTRIAQEMGWTAITIGEEYGGLGLGYVELIALLEEMGAHLLCSPFFSSICLGANALTAAATDEQRAEYLPGIASGATIATLALTESKGRWDACGIEATARRDGSEFVLDGVKSYVPDGHAADLLLVAARAPASTGENEVGLFAVRADASGLQRSALPTMDQTRRRAEVVLDGVRVAQSALLGGTMDAWPSLVKTLQLGASALILAKALCPLVRLLPCFRLLFRLQACKRAGLRFVGGRVSNWRQTRHNLRGLNQPVSVRLLEPPPLFAILLERAVMLPVQSARSFAAALRLALASFASFALAARPLWGSAESSGSS